MPLLVARAAGALGIEGMSSAGGGGERGRVGGGVLGGRWAGYDLLSVLDFLDVDAHCDRTYLDPVLGVPARKLNGRAIA
jgi:hypothetical protein